MARRKKKAKGRSRKGRSAKGRATTKRRTKKKTRKGKGQVPLKLLEKRLGKLNGIVKRRGGDAY